MPEPAFQRPPLLFIHGAWHGAWCWDDHFLPWFAARGWECAAVTLRGHGAGRTEPSVQWTATAAYLQDIEGAAAMFSQPPVLIAHSLGGYLAMRLLEKRPYPAVALLTPVPVTGSLPAFLREFRRTPRLVGRACVRADPALLLATPQLARHFLFTEHTPEVTVRRAHERLCGESMMATLETALRLPNPAAIRRQQTPLLVLAAGHDGLFSVAEQRRTARALNADFALVEDAGHDLMLDSAWPRAARLLHDWLEVKVGQSLVKVG